MKIFKYYRIRKTKKKPMSKTWTGSSGSDNFIIVYPAHTKIEIVKINKSNQYK